MISRRFLYSLWGVTALWFQGEESFHHLRVSGGAGFTTITGTNAGKLDHSGNVQLNGGYFFNRYYGIIGNFMSSDLGITRAKLDDINQPNGSARVYAVAAKPTVRLPLGRGFSAYALPGGGYLRRTVVLGTTVNNSGGFDVGGGLNMPLPRTSVKLAVEPRYFKGFTRNTDTTFVPTPFGIPW
jgi:hypothetical protein